MTGVPELLILSLLAERAMYGYELVRSIEQVTGAPGETSQLLLSSSLLTLLTPFASALGPLDLAELLRGLARAVLMFALGAVPAALLRRTRAQRSTSAA